MIQFTMIKIPPLIRKIIAPLIVSFGLIISFLVYVLLLFFMELPLPIRVIILICFVVLSAVVILVLMERIREIKKGEEDDLGKY